MLTNPWCDVIAKVDGRFGMMLMNAGPLANGKGGSGFSVRISYTLTSGSGWGRPCLTIGISFEEAMRHR